VPRKESKLSSCFLVGCEVITPGSRQDGKFARSIYIRRPTRFNIKTNILKKKIKRI
jgi:hypothetical protein